MAEVQIGHQTGRGMNGKRATTAALDVDRGLRRVLAVDAAISGVTGAALLIGAGTFGELLGFSEAMLRWVGVSLILWAPALVYLETRSVLSRLGVHVVMGINIAWVVASLALLASGQTSPTALGYLFVIGQALVVAVLAEFQFNLVRRMAKEDAD